MRPKVLFFVIAAVLFAGSANAQKTTWTIQGPSPTTGDSNYRHSGGNGNYDANGYWCAPAPPLETTTESASASALAYGSSSGVLKSDSRSASFSDYVNAPSSFGAASPAVGSVSLSLGEIARNLRKNKPQATPGARVFRQDNLGGLQICDASGGNCRLPQ
ncbi:MAG TPA: hypothetical protein VJO16_00245 [Candidatus Acidoferrum sp.]|nr:hypothetical protein [Candidatus Acidoferrum sp.]